MKPLLFALLLSSVIYHFSSSVAHAQTITPAPSSTCINLEISPDKPTYHQNETIHLTTQGQGDLSTIRVWWIPATQNLTQTDPNPWTQIQGTFDPTTQTWQGDWTTPTGNGEYLIVTNLIQSDGYVCSGNPGYSCTGCHQGVFVNNGLTPGTIPCQSCHKTIVVNQPPPANATIFDMPKYWNLKPGNYWQYTGTNRFYGNPINFTTRIGVEEPVAMCGQTQLPIRYTKDKPEAYIYPSGHGPLDLPSDDCSKHEGNCRNLRFFLSYFQPGERWSATTMGNTLMKHYRLPTPFPASLGTLGTSLPEQSVRTYANDPLRLFENIFYAPYSYGEASLYDGYEFTIVDKLYIITTPSCDYYYQANVTDRYFSLYVTTASVSTPAYSGPTVVIQQIEGSNPPGMGGWYTREDWYLAENIGIVKITKQNLNTQSCLTNPSPDCDVTRTMTNAPIVLQLNNYYIGGPLAIDISPTVVPKNGTYTLRATTSNGLPYNGYLAAKTCTSEEECATGDPFKWGYGTNRYLWVDNGVVQADLSQIPSLQPGLRHSYFRPWVDTPPIEDDDETVISNTELPWSNEVHIRITESTDLDNDQDTDFLDLLSFLTRPFTATSIFDFNLLHRSFGSTQ